MRFNCRPVILVILIISAAIALPAGASADEQPISEATISFLQDILSETVDLLWDQADMRWHEGDFDRCIVLFKMIVALAPSDIEAYTDGAWLLDSTGRSEEALAFLIDGLSKNQDRYEMYDEVGWFCFGKKEYQKSIGYYLSALKFEDCPLIVWHKLAHAYERSNMLEKSLETWEHVKSVNPDNPVADLNVRRVMEHLKDSEE